MLEQDFIKPKQAFDLLAQAKDFFDPETISGDSNTWHLRYQIPTVAKTALEKKDAFVEGGLYEIKNLTNLAFKKNDEDFSELAVKYIYNSILGIDHF